MSIIRSCLLAAVVAACVLPVSAQVPPPQPPDVAGDVAPDQGLEDRDTRELVETLMIVRLTRELGLDTEQTIKMVQRMEEVRGQIQQGRKERKDLLDTMRHNIESGTEDAVIQETLQKLRDHDRAAMEQRQRLFSEMGQGLTVAQQAKLYVFLDEFETDLRRLVQRARQQGRPGMGEGGPPDEGGQRPMERRGPWRDGYGRAQAEGPERPMDQMQGMPAGPPPGGPGQGVPPAGGGQRQGPPPGGSGQWQQQPPPQRPPQGY